MFIAGIGSRETPGDILDEMTRIGEWVRGSGKHYIVSGHAEGADWAFERGAQERCIVFLPWKTFNNHLQSNALISVPPLTQKAKNVTKRYHPAYDKLSHGALGLHCRNGFQILGSELGDILTGKVIPKRVNVVVCWTSDGKASGGTGQAIRIAEGHNIPVLNMYDDKWNTYEKVIAFLDTLETQN